MRAQGMTTIPLSSRSSPWPLSPGGVIETYGKPAMAVAIRSAVFGHFDLSLDEVATDADGRFLVAGVPVGCQYELQVESTTADEAGMGYTSPSGPEAKPVSVRPGQTTDLGALRFVDDPDIKLDDAP